ncbi:type I-E CRISPR-associated protein Cas6/Cse3/CasE [Gilvimarinus agarilyticus]|uniref:type I-E CRISPR-associated protein Cas6/Cse3/CasE n=1 Tax=Gilvimarinus sp. 2_MG-2023 TaxID=3062666 RepID=UPI001C08A0EC|nr:type I-E CRISPR-associated protein Cas6/Cse3/CasE [Gilvimarinus sp. 2_MG-2023]MBU2885468.1 type I-E CRISPR-associated protein Cas6/Cse3/CasE [Gilvimarinus agarilyticus]MDO6570368.1 type I-E CRISPR-associated protein Cas6/Cse3/CasE [Gilvimarinus sp. 2_MG-2023]
MFLTKVLPTKGLLLSQLTERAHQGDAYAQHQLLWQLFPNQENRNFLFRYEQERSGPCYYLLSSAEPSVELEGAQVVSKPFNPKLKEGDQLAYTLRANPTRMLKHDTPGQRGRRVDVLMHAKKQARQMTDVDIAQVQQQAAQDWLMDPARQTRMGVAFATAPEVTEHLQHQVYKSGGKSGQVKPIQFASVNYEGTLTVTDPECFLQLLQQGIGRAKAFGCGLMMIRRI